ncbi:unnamed protein product, partial [Porites lobata]
EGYRCHQQDELQSEYFDVNVSFHSTILYHQAVESIDGTTSTENDPHIDDTQDYHSVHNAQELIVGYLPNQLQLKTRRCGSVYLGVVLLGTIWGKITQAPDPHDSHGPSTALSAKRTSLRHPNRSHLLCGVSLAPRSVGDPLSNFLGQFTDETDEGPVIKFASSGAKNCGYLTRGGKTECK